MRVFTTWWCLRTSFLVGLWAVFLQEIEDELEKREKEIDEKYGGDDGTAQ